MNYPFIAAQIYGFDRGPAVVAMGQDEVLHPDVESNVVAQAYQRAAKGELQPGEDRRRLIDAVRAKSRWVYLYRFGIPEGETRSDFQARIASVDPRVGDHVVDPEAIWTVASHYCRTVGDAIEAGWALVEQLQQEIGLGRQVQFYVEREEPDYEAHEGS